MDWSIYSLFLVTTAVVCLSPGPAAIIVVAQSMSSGLRRSYFGIAGIALANAIYFGLSATGVAALIVASSTLFTVIKWIGVVYLLYLGCSAIFSKSGAIIVDAHHGQHALSGYRAFWQGLIVELSNPKALLYFVALLPQFVDPAQPIWGQMLIFGATCVFLDVAVYSLYAWLGSKTQGFTANPRFVRASNGAAGGLLILAGALMATVKRAH